MKGKINIMERLDASNYDKEGCSLSVNNGKGTATLEIPLSELKHLRNMAHDFAMNTNDTDGFSLATFIKDNANLHLRYVVMANVETNLGNKIMFLNTIPNEQFENGFWISDPMKAQRHVLPPRKEGVYRDIEKIGMGATHVCIVTLAYAIEARKVFD